ncbi:MAG: alpha,alpha-trehalose-phosphate synthase (UDP-forming) [Propylenella sp.]
MNRLFAISNRVGPLSDEGKAGGLAVGLADALRHRGGVWFGWSGNTSDEGTHGPLQITTEGKVDLVTVDMTQADLDAFYHGFANQSLWPVFHYRMDLANYDRRHAETYDRINERIGSRLVPLLKPDDLVWVHDYHFIPLGEKIRAGGFSGAIGFFLHVPFPPPEVIAALPRAHRLVRSMLSYDLVGFQTKVDRDNFVRFLISEFNAEEVGDGWVEAAGRKLHAGVFPIGIDSRRFAAFATGAEGRRRYAQLTKSLRGRRQIIGVDRLDYSKGIPDRLRAFERLLEDYPENHVKVSLLQVAPVSRGEVDAYAALRRELEELAGHINGVHGKLNWTPVRIMTRGFARKGLAGLFRASHVGLVTPLRDGMNLVAKEYVAAQDPDDPGVLVLSRFAGAAAELHEALIVNPYDVAEVAEALQRALQMPLEERKRRWAALYETIGKQDSASWCNSFLAALELAISRRRKAETGDTDPDTGADVEEAAPPADAAPLARVKRTASPRPIATT